MGVKDRPQCYFDVELNREPVGRIVFQLFSDICPRTSKNFLCLCTGEKGTGKVTGKELCYKGSTFHRVVKNFMIQGGDFTEGNGRGGESIYGGYFEDENFILKHDRPFLLSMANRGKNTNGSQFFVTTKMAPHLDGVDVVFGHVISGFEVIKKIERLKTDSSSRPYADVRVVDCGQLITKSANDVLEGKRKRASLNSDDSSSHSSVESEGESEQNLKHQKNKKHAKVKQSKKKRKVGKKKINILPSEQSSPGPAEKEMENNEAEEEKEPGGKREKPVVRPEEIPPVPENRFLLRRDMPSQEIKADVFEKEKSTLSADQKPAVSKSGRKIRGRGTIRYHTPTRSKSRSASVEERGSSETPPHWKEEMKRTKNYQPPSTERWSKGDKLNDHSSRWEDRSNSARSQSGVRSSDHSCERSSLHHQKKKEKKKAKHKKKSKKQKHGKKKSSKNKPQEHFMSEGERSASSERKSGRSRSPTRSPSLHHARKRQRSSPSNSRSYTSSRSRSRGRYRSYSRSRSLSRSRSRSLSRFRSPSFSRSRSRNRSRCKSRSRSRSTSTSRSESRKRSQTRSPKKRKIAKPKQDVTANVKLPEKKITIVPKLPTVPEPERIPVIPLSDSPPPSRWKPGQKPWKPSYIHIQEIKAKVAPTKPAAVAPVVKIITEKASVTQKSVPEGSQDHKAHKPAHRSRSRSSRSKSYSRSRSKSSSRSRSRSSHRDKSRSSSHNRSESVVDQKTSSKKEESLDKEWNEYYSSLNRIKNLDKFVSLSNSGDGLTELEKGSGSEMSHDVIGSLETIKDRGNSQDPETIYSNPLLTESFNSWSELDSDSEQVSQSTGTVPVKMQKQDVQSNEVPDKKLSSLTGWNSDSDSEKITSRTVTIYEKEEGEASSESDNETLKKTLEASSAYKIAAAAAPSSSSSSGQTLGSPEKVVEPEKHKSKKKAKRKHKHKRRSENKANSHHGKVKAKKSKRKHQKLKETFHWQPPLEFEEEEEEESKVERLSPVKENYVKETSKKDSYPPKEEERRQQRLKEGSNKNTKHSEPRQHSSNSNSANSSHLSRVKVPEILEDMVICTPEHCVDVIETPFAQDLYSNTSGFTLKSTSESSEMAGSHGTLLQSKENPAASSTRAVGQKDEATKAVINFKWKPLKGMSAPQNLHFPPVAVKNAQTQQSQMHNARGVRMEIKSKSRVRPGSLFDEVRKTAKLHQRPRNQESSSEEKSPSVGKTSRTLSPKKSGSLPRKSRSASSQGSRSRESSHSYSRSRSRSRSSTYSSRSRSRSRRRHRRRSRSRSSTYHSYRSNSRTYSRSPSRSHSYNHHRRSRSDSDDSYSSRSVSRRRGRRRSDSYRSSERRSRSYRSSSRSVSRRRRRSRSSGYS
ncbi:NK-tumor recognition protein isoform X2 [Nematolebias whitei]|uniref:NK-tumor recognition protein isoform X2 n=1 Tax=Nematolebias whitei TaxID=451745 RepID=UPI001897FE4C|nr:NK-tumor recognition protein isoform X2 [Nematolebias whitei]